MAVPEIDLPFLGRVSVAVLAIPLLYGPLAIWIVLRLAGLTVREGRGKRPLGRAADKGRRPPLLFWACEDCHSLTPEPARVCYSCGAVRAPDARDPASLPAAEADPSMIPLRPRARTMKTPRAPAATAAARRVVSQLSPATAEGPETSEPVVPLPGVDWQAGVESAAGPAQLAAIADGRAPRRGRPKLTVVIPDPESAEAIRQVERFAVGTPSPRASSGDQAKRVAAGGVPQPRRRSGAQPTSERRSRRSG